MGQLGTDRVEVTGGEPLAQEGAIGLLTALCGLGGEVLLETNGSLDIAAVDSRVARIVDFKCPSSGHSEANRWENVERLTPRDEVKFVLADQADFHYACERVERHRLCRRCAVFFSPVHGQLAPATLAAWILQAGLDVRLGLQLHKMLWPDQDRGV